MSVTVDNTDVDTACAAVSTPFGPFTRVSDVEAFPVPNSDQEITVTTALGDTLTITYEKLLYDDAAVAAAKRVASGYTATVEDWKALIAAEKTALDALTAPHTYAEYLVRLRAKKSAIADVDRGYL